MRVGKMILDQHNRVHDYLRIALTDNCNFRCSYCMPEEQLDCLPKGRLMTTQEIISIATVFQNLGIKKIRLTGGEPLLRKDFGEIVSGLGSLPIQLHLTTNAALLDKYLDLLLKNGVHSLNISLDSLQSERFHTITRRNVFKQVLRNIYMALEAGFSVKLNVVLIKGINHDEINDFIELTKNNPVHIRFIEFMPFDKNNWSASSVVFATEILDVVAEEYEYIPLPHAPHETARKYKPLNHSGTFAIISTMSHPFCGDCNRIRLTADGKLKNCLFSQHETDLLSALRNGESIENLIIENIYNKFWQRGGQINTTTEFVVPESIKNRRMIHIGG